MPPERVERKLAAILAADVAGYSRLVGADEEGTLRRLRAHRKELIDPKITEHQGRVVKVTGDGILIEFPSAAKAAVPSNRTTDTCLLENWVTIRARSVSRLGTFSNRTN